MPASKKTFLRARNRPHGPSSARSDEADTWHRADCRWCLGRPRRDGRCAARRRSPTGPDIRHAIERVETHRLGCDVDISHRLIERRHTDDVRGLVDWVELHRLVRTDDAAPPVGPAPDAIVIVHHHHRLDLLAQFHVERTGIAGCSGALKDALVQPFTEAVNQAWPPST